jgi:hypothetical protein
MTATCILFSFFLFLSLFFEVKFKINVKIMESLLTHVNLLIDFFTAHYGLNLSCKDALVAYSRVN